MAREARGRAADGSLDVTSGVIWRQLLQLFLPIFVGTFFQQAYQLVNTWIVGRCASVEALGGIQATQSLNELAVGFCVGVGTGCSIVCGQYFGAGDDERLSRSVHTAIAVAIVLGLAMSVAVELALEPLLRAMGTPAALLPESLAYCRLYLGVIVSTLVYDTGSAILRAIGDTRTPSLVIMSTCVLNVLLDLVFVAGLGLEAAGCGISTAISVSVGAIAVCWKLAHADAAWRLHPSHIRIDRPIARVMVRTGLPLGLQSAAYSISNVIVQSSVNSFGEDPVTGWGLAGRLDGIVWMVADSLGIAVTTFCAQNFGARNYDRMRRCLHASLAMSLALVGGIAGVIVGFAEPIARFFVSDASVVRWCVLTLRWIGPFYVLYSVSANISGAIRGSGESLRPMLLTLFGSCVLRIAWVAWVMPAHADDIFWLMLVYPITWVATDVLFVVYYRAGNWLGHARERERSVLGR